MPELPEVEVTRRRLAPHLIGRTIREVLTTRPSYFFLTPPRRLARVLPGRRAVALRRVGKHLVAALDDGSQLLLHLGMTGDLGPSLAPPDAHTHLQLRFEGGGRDVAFRDPRKFGKIEWIAAGRTSPRLERLGPDALAATAEVLEAAFRSRRAAVKTALLDQTVLAGVGNIYADEALHASRIHPARPARALAAAEHARLAAAIVRVMRRSIARGAGYSERPDGFRVYGRAGAPCARCGTPIVRVVLGQRATHFCPRCQPRRRVS